MRLTALIPTISLLLTSTMASQLPLGTPTWGKPPTRKNMDNFEVNHGPGILCPRKMLELPRPGAAIADKQGDLAYMVVSQHSFTNKKTEKSAHVFSLSGNASVLTITGDTFFWLNSTTLAHVSETDGIQKLEAVTLGLDENANAIYTPRTSTIGELPKGAGAGNFQYAPESGILVFSADVYADYNLSTVAEQDEKWNERGTTAYVFDDTYVRHWDHWRGPKQTRLFSVDLTFKDEKWNLGSTFYRPLFDTDHFTPVEPFGGTDDFSVNKDFILYTAKDPSVPYATHTRQNIYLAPIKGHKRTTGLTDDQDDLKVTPKHLTSGSQGATHSPSLSPDGKKAVWLELARDGYESDHFAIVMYDLETGVRFFVAKPWDRSPDSIAFSHSGKHLVFTAGDEGHIKVFTLPVPPTPPLKNPVLAPEDDPLPVALTELHFASGAQVLPHGRILYTSNSLASPNNAYILSGLDNPGAPLEIKQLTKFGKEVLDEVSLEAGEEFWFEGAKGVQVHGFAVKPKGWKEGKKNKYPAVLLIHGGPQGAWEDSWSTRWNPNVFAQQGYFTIFINPTGSTTYGQNFTDAITEDWGGRPFEDLRLGWDFVLENYPEIDPERTAAAGASWGGFAINWIQGHPEFGFGFKALVCHDGVFDTHYNGFSTDELFFFNHDFGGPPWLSKAPEIFNPSKFVQRWGTPQLVIHSGKDYRLAETEGIGAFHALQQRGIPSRFLYFPDENHWVLKPDNSLKWHYEVFKWLAEFTGKDV